MNACRDATAVEMSGRLDEKYNGRKICMVIALDVALFSRSSKAVMLL